VDPISHRAPSAAIPESEERVPSTAPINPALKRMVPASLIARRPQVSKSTVPRPAPLPQTGLAVPGPKNVRLLSTGTQASSMEAEYESFLRDLGMG
jgi:hypothetical protein